MKLLTSFFILLGLSAFAVPKKTSEGAGDLIEKAYNLTLQKDRQQAIGILVTAIKRENAGIHTKELHAALQEVGGMFLGDKAQQVYELALSLRKTDINQAQTKINEGLKVEPDNIQFLAQSARMQILKGDCSGAAEAMSKIRKWDPYDEQILLVSGQAAICIMDIPSYAVLRAQADVRKGPYSKAWLNLELEKNAKEKATDRLEEGLAALKKADPLNPEIPFWEWKLESNPKTRKLLAQKYLGACKNLSVATFRRYMVDTLVCRHLTEIEAEPETPGTP